LKLKHEAALPSLGFNFNLCRYILDLTNRIAAGKANIDALAAAARAKEVDLSEAPPAVISFSLASDRAGGGMGIGKGQDVRWELDTW
jgi:hypothetical protein